MKTQVVAIQVVGAKKEAFLGALLEVEAHMT